LNFEELAGGLSALLGREVDQASVIAGVFGGGSSILKENEVARIVKELVGISGHGSDSEVDAIVDAIFYGVGKGLRDLELFSVWNSKEPLQPILPSYMGRQLMTASAGIWWIQVVKKRRPR